MSSVADGSPRVGAAAWSALPEHLGRLHPYEHALVLLLAFGPFVVLAIAVYVAKRREDSDEDR